MTKEEAYQQHLRELQADETYRSRAGFEAGWKACEMHGIKCLADIQEILGDSEGKLKQDELVELIRFIVAANKMSQGKTTDKQKQETAPESHYADLCRQQHQMLDYQRQLLDLYTEKHHELVKAINDAEKENQNLKKKIKQMTSPIGLVQSVITRLLKGRNDNK